MGKIRRRVLGFAAASALVLSSVGSAVAHDQHGPGDNHLTGDGAFGNLELLSSLRLTDTPEIVADVAVNPAGTHAFLANWGEPDCAGPEVGGQTSPDAGAWIVDITDLENPKEVGFIPSSQDSRPGEGMQVVNVTTKFFSGDMLVMNNEHCGKNGKGGVSLYDVTTPERPKRLSEHFGDHANLSPGDANDIHSAFAWDTGDKAYVVIVDNFENTDVDILDITNPSRPRLIAEHQLDALFPRTTQTPLGLVTINLHDMVVKHINGRWVMLASYWDGGYIQIDVTNPVSPTLIGDTDYADPDPELLESTGIALGPEGNGHQAEFTANNQYFIATDEDFAPYGATSFAIATGPNAGPYPSRPVPGAAPIVTLDDEVLNGPTVYGGYGCPTSAAIPPRATALPATLPAGEEAIVVLQRGPAGDPSAPEAACFPGDKAHQAALAGYDAVLFVNHHAGEAVSSTAPFCGSGAFVDDIVGVCTNHAAFHKLFNTVASSTYPEPPAIGALGEKISATAAFDGWGYVHLYSNTPTGPANNPKFAELDTYAIDEAHEEQYAVGFGDLTVHEVATHPRVADRAYLSYYAGGMRALQIQGTELVETGGYLDENGNNFWGVEVFERGGDTIILGSDRDSGLWIFRDTDL